MLLILTTLLCCTGISEKAWAQPPDDGRSLVWNAYAPVEHMKNNNLHYVKTYYFDANPHTQTTDDVNRLKQTYDSLAPITIGKVFMGVKEDESRLDSSTWYWWSVREEEKAYIVAYIPTAYSGASSNSYYKITFKDGTSYKWTEPHESPYNFHSMFILVDGRMLAMDKNKQEHFNVEADQELRNKFLTTPIYYITKYSGYTTTTGNAAEVEYEPVLQYVFSDDEAGQLLRTLRALLRSYPATASR